MQTQGRTAIYDPKEMPGVGVVAERRDWVGKGTSRLHSSWTCLGEEQMPLLMEGLEGSIWLLALAHTSEEQALGMMAHPAWHILCSIWGSTSAEAGPPTH